MSVLKSIFTLLGGGYRADEYNRDADDQKAGAGYYAFSNGDTGGVGNYTLRASLTDTQDKDPKMPYSYSTVVDTDEVPPPLIEAVHSKKIFNKVSSLKTGGPCDQIICAIPVYYGTPQPKSGSGNGKKGNDTTYKTHPKGVVQCRVSQRGDSPAEAIAPERVALAEYVTQYLSPLLEPQGTEDRQFRDKLDTIGGTTEFLRGLNTLWERGIKNYSMATYEHVRRVTELVTMMAKEIRAAKEGPMSAIDIDEEKLELLALSAQLHDLGKLYTPLAILESGVPVPGTRYELTKAESAIMGRHAQDVYDVLDIPGLTYLNRVRDICGAHHVHANGNGGYPRQVLENLKHGVPFEAKLLAVADIFEALTADREYREGIGLPLSTTLTIMAGMAKRGEIDPQVLRFCVETGLFERYASDPEKKHISQYDRELLEKLGYSSSHMQEALAAKEAVCEDTGLKMPQLQAFLKMPEKKLWEKLAEESRKPAGEEDPDFLTQEQFDRILRMKRELNELFNKSNPGAVDDIYIDKLLCIGEEEGRHLDLLKCSIIDAVWPDNKTAAGKKTEFEEMVAYEMRQIRALRIGAVALNAPANLERYGDGVKEELTALERTKIKEAKAIILERIPSASLSATENFYFFTPRRYRAAQPTQDRPGM